MEFLRESDLVEKAVPHLPLRRWLRVPESASLFQAREVKGFFGVPDFVAAVVPSDPDAVASTPSIAFEMKLSDWRRGLIQAFRYRTFARVVYLVLDASRVGPALRNSERFERSNVGLVGLDAKGTLTVYHEPDDEEPFCPHMAERFMWAIRTEGGELAEPHRSERELALEKKLPSCAPLAQRQPTKSRESGCSAGAVYHRGQPRIRVRPPRALALAGR
jgi:hypothetical protein